MKKNIIHYPNLKQIEQIIWRKLQETFSEVFTNLLLDMDKQIAEERDKKRYRETELLSGSKNRGIRLFIRPYLRV